MPYASILIDGSRGRRGSHVWIIGRGAVFRSQKVQPLREKEDKSGNGESEAKIDHGKNQKDSTGPLVFTPTEAPEVEAEEAKGKRDGNKYHRNTRRVTNTGLDRGSAPS